MEFCPRCKSMLLPKKLGKELALKCSNKSCSYVRKGNAGAVAESKKFSEKVAAPKIVEVIDKEATPMPKTAWNCSKCGAKEAYYWSVQLRRGDEAETSFFRCVNCGKTWRRSG